MDLGPLPKVHPRSITTRQASLELDEFLFKLQQVHRLSYPEMYYILANSMKTWATLELRDEYHIDEGD